MPGAYGAALGETPGEAVADAPGEADGGGITSFWPGMIRFGLAIPFAASSAWSVTPNDVAIRPSWSPRTTT
jgi:hypothetical protein